VIEARVEEEEGKDDPPDQQHFTAHDYPPR
jgi:hypothetical protein